MSSERTEVEFEYPADKDKMSKNEKLSLVGLLVALIVVCFLVLSNYIRYNSLKLLNESAYESIKVSNSFSLNQVAYQPQQITIDEVLKLIDEAFERRPVKEVISYLKSRYPFANVSHLKTKHPEFYSADLYLLEATVGKDTVHSFLEDFYQNFKGKTELFVSMYNEKLIIEESGVNMKLKIEFAIAYDIKTSE